MIFTKHVYLYNSFSLDSIVFYKLVIFVIGYDNICLN